MGTEYRHFFLWISHHAGVSLAVQYIFPLLPSIHFPTFSNFSLAMWGWPLFLTTVSIFELWCSIWAQSVRCSDRKSREVRVPMPLVPSLWGCLELTVYLNWMSLLLSGDPISYNSLLSSYCYSSPSFFPPVSWLGECSIAMKSRSQYTDLFSSHIRNSICAVWFLQKSPGTLFKKYIIFWNCHSFHRLNGNILSFSSFS